MAPPSCTRRGLSPGILQVCRNFNRRRSLNILQFDSGRKKNTMGLWESYKSLPPRARIAMGVGGVVFSLLRSVRCLRSVSPPTVFSRLLGSHFQLLGWLWRMRLIRPLHLLRQRHQGLRLRRHQNHPNTEWGELAICPSMWVPFLMSIALLQTSGASVNRKQILAPGEQLFHEVILLVPCAIV